VRKSAKDSFGAGWNKRGAFRCPRLKRPNQRKEVCASLHGSRPQPTKNSPFCRSHICLTFWSNHTSHPIAFARSSPQFDHSRSPTKKALAMYTIMDGDDPLSFSDITHHFQECCTRILGVTTFRLVCLGKIRRYLVQPRNCTNHNPTASRGVASSFSAF
jgi:hypothetical protein